MATAGRYWDFHGGGSSLVCRGGGGSGGKGSFKGELNLTPKICGGWFKRTYCVGFGVFQQMWVSYGIPQLHVEMMSYFEMDTTEKWGRECIVGWKYILSSGPSKGTSEASDQVPTSGTRHSRNPAYEIFSYIGTRLTEGYIQYRGCQMTLEHPSEVL